MRSCPMGIKSMDDNSTKVRTQSYLPYHNTRANTRSADMASTASVLYFLLHP
jgi:hypothetical protein